MLRSLVGSEMCIRDRLSPPRQPQAAEADPRSPPAFSPFSPSPSPRDHHNVAFLTDRQTNRTLTLNLDASPSFTEYFCDEAFPDPTSPQPSTSAAGSGRKFVHLHFSSSNSSKIYQKKNASLCHSVISVISDLWFMFPSQNLDAAVSGAHHLQP